MFKELKGQYVMLRTNSAGVFAGTLDEISADGKMVKALNARRICTSETEEVNTLSIETENCPMETPFVILTEVIEILPISENDKSSIVTVPIWIRKTNWRVLDDEDARLIWK